MSRITRLSIIFYTAWRFNLFGLICDNLKPGVRKTLLGLLSSTSPSQLARGERIRLALEALGPIFVKFGQVLSTRRDLLPDDVSNELAKLQDQVPPFSNEQSKAIIEAALGQPIEHTFSLFDATPVASASVAQVHFGVLRETDSHPEWANQEVAIKVLRPGILPVIESDLALMHDLACIVEKISEDGRRLKPREVVAEFDSYLHDELDLMREAANASQLRRNFADSELDPDYLIDLATLTGAATLGLGRQYAAMYTRNTTVAKKLAEAGNRVGDRVWQMPLVDDYSVALASDVADFNHTADKFDFSAGSVTAALFLEKFVGDRTWVHLDIAGTGRSEVDAGENIKGGTGYGVRLLIEWLDSF